MKPPRLEESVTIAAAPERVFAWADDPANTGWHMIRWVANREKVWRTVGQPRLLVMAAFQMGLTVTPFDTGARLKVTLEYELPRRGLPRLLGQALAAPYGRWCLRRVCRDAKAALEDSGKGLDVARVTRCGGPLAMALLAGACARPAVVVTPPGPGVPAGRYVDRVQREDALGGTSNVAEARVHVEIRPFRRRPACETPGEDTERVRRPNVQPPSVAGRL